MAEWPSSPDAYQFVSEQSAGKLWRAKVIRGKREEEVVIHTINVDETKVSSDQILNTVASLCTVAHPKISPVLHYFMVPDSESESSLWIVHPPSIEEDCCVRDLAIEKHQKNTELCRSILRQVLEVIDFLHKHDKIWYDVRGSNIFVNKSGQVKVSLVSLRSVVQLKTRDSLPFVAPELITRAEIPRDIAPRLDLWSFGMTGVQLWQGEPPYATFTAQEIMNTIVQQDPPIPTDIDNDFLDVLRACFQKDVNQRITAAKLLQFPFFAATNDQTCISYLQTYLETNCECDAGDKAIPQPQMVQEVINNCPIESYLGETTTHFVVVIRTIPATQLSFLLEANQLKITARLPSLITEAGVTLLTPQNLTSEKIVHFPGPISPVDSSVVQDPNSNSLVLRIQKFVPVNLGSQTFIT